MRKLASLATFGLAAFIAAQQEPDTYSPRPNPLRDAEYCANSTGYQAFLRDVGGTWTCMWNQATGTPMAIYGDGIKLNDWRGNSLEEGRRQANAALTRFADLLGLGASDFRESIGARMGRTWSFTFDQFFRNVPVVGGRVDVRVNMAGVIAFLGSTAFQIPAGFNTMPALGDETAAAVAWQALAEVAQLHSEVPQPGKLQPNRLVIWGKTESDRKEPFFLAWEVPVSAVDRNGAGPIGRYYIDAMNGRVLHYTSDKHDCGFAGCTDASHHGSDSAPPVPTQVTIMGWVRDGQSAIDPLHNIPLVGIEVSVPGIGTLVTDANGQINPDITAPVSITVNTNGVHNRLIQGANAPTASATIQPGVPQTIQMSSQTASSNESSHLAVRHWLHAANEMCRTILGNSAQLNTADNVLPTVNIGSTCNAYYTNNTVNFYAAGGSCNNTGFSTVAVHEWGHGLDDQYGGISQTQGLSEGWGDIIGMYLVDNPIVGIYFTTSGGYVRNGMNNTNYPPPSEVHAAGEVWMGFAWRLRENLRASLGTTQAIAVSNDIVIGSIAANATNQTNAVIQVFVADDNDGNLNNGVPHYNELSAAATTKNLPYPHVQLATITHVALGNTSARLVPREVDATATIVSSGTITQLRLVYNAAGAGSQTRVMVPNGQPNGYKALLPGIVSGQITYHLEAQHSSGPFVRLPETGEFSYAVSVAPTGPFVGFYAENFDGAVTGWTHAQVATQDDWQVGHPAGRSGTSSGQAWSDPSNAFSGNNCYGNDLGNTIGATNWNGAYGASVSNYLRSPAINCAGRTGVTLRFKRWLTVEEGIFDQATLLVNGAPVWSNPLNGNLRDLSWQSIELPIPMADNNPAVQLEWRLVSDAGLQLGGWNIDDIELGERFTPPLDAMLRITPEQAAANTPASLLINTTGAAPFVFVLGDTAGPLAIPGVPVLQVGGTLATFSGFTNSLGVYAATFNVPMPSSAVGITWFSQVLTLDASLNVVASNPWRSLFTQ